MEEAKIKKYAKIGAAGIAALIVGVASVSTVDLGSRGVITRFGSPGETIYNPGIHFKLPFVDSMNEVSIATLKVERDCGAASKDLQTVSSKIALNYHVKPDKVLYILRDLGNDEVGRIIEPALHEAVKAVTANYTAEELIAKREEVRNAIITDLSAKLERHGLVIDELSIINFDFSKVFNEAIEQKTTAEQLKLKAQNDLLRIQVEAEQKIATAKAEAESLRLQRQEVTPEVLQLRAIEKWNGVLPQVTGGSMPLINLK